MGFNWRDYDPDTMDYIESWLDESAVKTTGLEEGFRAFYEYWIREDGFSLGDNFWCKVVFDNRTPFAVIAFCLHKGTVMVMEILVAPEKRRQGYGAKMLKALVTGKRILGFAIQRSEAVIFPNNIASRKAFESAGFRYHHTHPDGDALYYVYESVAKN